MSDEKSLIKINPKYNCMVSGEKRMSPCAGCGNTKACLSSAMQYKENEEMDQEPIEAVEEKAVVKIDADGEVMKCAKGMASGDCGYKAGAKVCGACGAMAVEAKALVDEEMDDEEDDVAVDADAEDDAAEGEMDDEETDEKGWLTRRVRRGMKAGEEEMTSEDEEDAAPATAPTDEEEEAMAMRKRMRQNRMNSMGVKSADFDDNAYVCAFERKMHSGGASVCENCPGGCAPEGNLPGLLDVEGIAEDMFSGKVLDSGYSDMAELYVVDVERKDGKTVEAFFEGRTGECVGWHLLDTNVIDEKSAFDASGDIIDFDQAAKIAVKSFDGNVIGVEPDVFEGFDSYAVEIDMVDGKSYDVYVSLDGKVLGYDEYSAEEAEEIEAEAAEIALKRAYSDEAREEMAKQSLALPDGSYPIKDEEDLRNAIQAYGRAKDKDLTKAHIIKRAMDLGKEDLIPMNWVPKKIQDEAAGGKKDDSDAFIAKLMEFEMLVAEEDLTGDN